MRHVALACLVALLADGASGCKGCSDPPRPAVADLAEAATNDTTLQTEPDGAPVEDAWRRVTPKGAGFSVEFPGEPDHGTEMVTSGSGVEAELHQFKVSEELTGRMMMVSYNALVGPLVDLGDADSALASLVADQKSGPRRAVVSERAVEQDGFKGYELVMTGEDFGSDEMRVTWRVFIVGARLYQVLATANDDPSRARVKRFLASFTFTEEAKGAEVDAGKRDRWKRHVSADGMFRAAFPGEPEVVVAPTDTAWGKREVRTLTAVSAFPPALYTLVVVPLEPTERALPLGEQLGAWEAFTLKGRGDVTLTMKQRAAVVVAGHTARVLEVTAQREDGDVAARYLGLPFGDRFYELGFLPLDERAGITEASRFFDGFAPSETPAPAPSDRGPR